MLGTVFLDDDSFIEVLLDNERVTIIMNSIQNGASVKLRGRTPGSIHIIPSRRIMRLSYEEPDGEEV